MQLVAESKRPYRKPSTEAAVMMFHSLRILGDPQLAGAFLGGISGECCAYTHLWSKTFTDMLIAMCSELGWNKLQPGLNQLVGSCAAEHVDVCAKFLDSLATSESALTSQQLEAGRQLASIICNVLVAEEDVTQDQPTSYRYCFQFERRCRSKEFVCHIFKAFCTLCCGDQLEAVLAAFTRQPNRYPLTTVLVPAAEELLQWVKGESTPLLSLVSQCVSSLERSKQEGIPKPSWSQEANLRCSCGDCTKLQAFLKDPLKKEARFKVSQARRSHLKGQLYCCDTTHVTDRCGVPQTLVVTKGRRSYNTKLAEHEHKLRLLDHLRPLYSQLISCGEDQPSAKRLRVGQSEPDASATCIDLTED